jgi:hypothetical protein
MKISGLNTSIENGSAEFRNDMATFADVRDFG